MSKASMKDMSIEELAEHLKQGQLDAIDQRLKIVGSRLNDLQPLIELRDRLQSARRALLNERAVASGGGRGLSQAEVVSALASLGRASVYELAQKLGANEAAVRGHLNRGKGERFDKLADNHWMVREPENDPEEDDE
jgi:DNA-binding CsgD family transcriptional regulator